MQPNHLIHSNLPLATVLVVDDEEGICRLLAKMLEREGYAVDIALSAEAALEAMQRFAADVALCDIRMPGRGGVWLIEQLQQQYPHTAIVIATGLRNLDPRLTLKPGIIGYLVKTFEVEQVQEVVQKAVDAVRALPRSSQRLRLVPPSNGKA